MKVVPLSLLLLISMVQAHSMKKVKATIMEMTLSSESPSIAPSSSLFLLTPGTESSIAPSSEPLAFSDFPTLVQSDMPSASIAFDCHHEGTHSSMMCGDTFAMHKKTDMKEAKCMNGALVSMMKKVSEKSVEGEVFMKSGSLKKMKKSKSKQGNAEKMSKKERGSSLSHLELSASSNSRGANPISTAAILTSLLGGVVVLF